MITKDRTVVARRMRGAQSIARFVVIYFNTLYKDPAYRGLSLGALRVMSAIRNADAEGKPLGPTGLAKLLNMPRSTAQLYAEELVNRKLVKKIGCAYVPDPMHLAVDRSLYGVIVDAIIKCGRELEALGAEAEAELKAESKSRAIEAAPLDTTPALIWSDLPNGTQSTTSIGVSPPIAASARRTP